MPTITIYEALRRASSFLENASREPKVAEILLLHELGLTKASLISSLRDSMTQEAFSAYMDKIKQHATTGIPVQHLTGVEQFYGRDFTVNEHVLIPRPETEELIVAICETVRRKNRTDLTICDVGTGSGIIAITLAHELAEWKPRILATDLSPEALIVAKQNGRNHQAKIEFYQGDFLSPLMEKGEKIDLLVSNPPYIDPTEKKLMSDTVKNFDPDLALFAPNHGLAAYEAIIQQAKFVLNKDAILAFEIGYQQGMAVSDIIKTKFQHAKVNVLQDINGKDRMVMAELIG
ncbi:peptide chain release factor N(5)-glutamine methyltransferase [Gracilibacillus dipsosauri]|uniref:Release factor glutamine methyltransferase n=1 Tax=Gracilibacillus dipsosauri TaxID=178340 RepID=A0A317KTZ7_9BACI|nr:peptide chain release factor N(5)-glutamine methyltransferase [Gracilibacillus dipsosauri]PWU67002.1 peptide chain release factor N(5)-glutamine methyltransferase [Gracilibacillus dipsosauri]